MLRTALSTAALAVFALTTQAQQGPAKPAVMAGKAIDTAGKAVLPIGPRLAGEEKLTAQERAERTFLMPPRKKMPSLQPAPAPQPEAAHHDAVAIGPPTADQVAAEEAAKAEAAAPAAATHHSSVRRHRSTRSHSASSRRQSTTKKKSTKKSSSSKKKRRSSRR